MEALHIYTRYEVCTKSIRLLSGRRKVCKFMRFTTNLLQSRSLGTEHSSPSVPAIAGNRFCRHLAGMAKSCVVAFRILSSRSSNRDPFSGCFSFGNNQNSQGAMVLALTQSNMSWEIDRRSSCCSCESNFGTNLAATLHMPKSFFNIEFTDPTLIPSSSEIS